MKDQTGRWVDVAQNFDLMSRDRVKRITKHK